MKGTTKHLHGRLRGAEADVVLQVAFCHKCSHCPVIWGCLRKWVLERLPESSYSICYCPLFSLSSMWSSCTRESWRIKVKRQSKMTNSFFLSEAAQTKSYNSYWTIGRILFTFNKNKWIAKIRRFKKKII